MGMPCEVNNILKLRVPDSLSPSSVHRACKTGYRIIPIDVPIYLVNENWTVYADVVIRKLSWEGNMTSVTFEIIKVYDDPFYIGEKSLANVAS